MTTANGARAGKPAHTVSVARMMGLETASHMLGGQAALAGVLAIGERAVRAKLAADRGVSDADLVSVADALRARGEKLIAHADKLVALTRPKIDG